ncbi:MAG TPA: glycosyltransferase family 39 protein, partial [Candidatus Goldiibacteriota bacterium]|nr:glycosyltransferase family 39 protein [Candidatus Goldiibacteriota bacterium]
AYIGSMVLEGKTPYLDAWDHKPPLIYFINAAVFRIFGMNFRSIALFEIFWVMLSCLSFFLLCRRLFDFKSSALCLVLFACYFGNPAFAESYGMTETYMALPAMLCVYMIYAGLGGVRIFIAGACASVAFFIKQPGIAVLAPAVFLLARQKPVRPSLFILFFTGFAAPAAVILAFFASRGSLDDFISQAFLYNLHYLSPAGAAEPAGGFLLKRPALLTCALLGIGFIVARARPSDKKPVLAAIAAWAIADTAFVLAGSKNFSHYYVQLIPSYCLLAGFFFLRFGQFGWKFSAPVLASVFIFSGMTSGAEYSIRQLSRERPVTYINKMAYTGSRMNTGAIKWILENTAAPDRVYIWGAETGINFITSRKSGHALSYVYPLYGKNHGNAALKADFLRSFSSSPPEYLMDTYGFLANNAENDGGPDEIRNFIRAHYSGRCAAGGWDVYVLNKK